MSAPFTTRPPWPTAPAGLRSAVEERLGSTVVASHDVHGGMSPGPAAVLSLDSGTRVFVKAVSRTVNAGSHQLYEQEATVLKILPDEAPAAALMAVVETGDWIALITTYAPGRAAGPPWTTAAVAAVVEACETLASVAAPAAIPPVIDRLPDLDGWARLAGKPHLLNRWETRHIERLAVATHGWRDWTSGQHLTHQDIRCDNAVIDPAGNTATLVDWGYCSAGARWLDPALLAADVMAAGHADGAEAARRQALDLVTDAPRDASRFVIAQAGMWRSNSTLPAHPGMPTHRAWQRARAAALQPLIEDLLAQIGM
jgi:aminoglycoside phosphotransferase (APT) family kinase protein